MSMLAERKRKQQWSLNPRGKLWAEVTNGFGQKMLEKVGWKHGKGLGAKEDGMIDSLKVAYKNDNKGIGYKEIEQWTVHDENFSSFLQNLNGNVEQSSDNAKITSLEVKSQNCRARIHYHKFMKGKDLSRYSEKDLANIFGKKTLKIRSVDDINKNELKPSDPKETNEDILINRGSMVDYFKKKLPNFGRKNTNYVIGYNGVLAKKTSDSENDRIGIGFSQVSNGNGEENEGNKKKKKRKYVETFTTYLDKDSENSEEIEDCKQKKKHKKKKLNENFVSYVCEDIEEINKNEEDSEQCAEVIIESKKKEWNKLNENLGNKEQNGEDQNEEAEGTAKQKIKKRKEKEKMKLNSLEDSSNNESIHKKENGINHEDNFSQPKHKKSKTSKLNGRENGYVQINEERLQKQNEGSITEGIEDHRDETKKPKKYKLKKSILEGNDSTIANDQIECNFKEMKKKKKKNQNNIAVKIDDKNNAQINEIYETSLCENKKMMEHKIKQKKSKRNNEENNSVGITNPIFNDLVNNISTENCSLQTQSENTSIEESVEQKESKKQDKITNSQRQNVEGIIDIAIENDSNDLRKKKSEKHKINSPKIQGTIKEIGLTKEEIQNEVLFVNKNEKVKSRKEQENKKNQDNKNIGISNPAFDDFNNSMSNESYSLQEKCENEETVLSEDTPRKKKKRKQKSEEIFEEGIDNPLFDISSNDQSKTEVSSNPYEVKIKKKKKKLDKEETGLDNPALNLSDIIPETDLMLNVVNTPVILKKSIEKFDLSSSMEKLKNTKRKTVRFSDVLQERIIPNDSSERTNEYISNRNELFDINTMLVEKSVKEEMEKQGVVYNNGVSSFESSNFNFKDQQDINRKVVESSVKEELKRAGSSCGFINNGFDIRSVDKVNFYETKYEIKSADNKGIDNRAFNKLKITLKKTSKPFQIRSKDTKPKSKTTLTNLKLGGNFNEILIII